MSIDLSMVPLILWSFIVLSQELFVPVWKYIFNELQNSSHYINILCKICHMKTHIGSPIIKSSDYYSSLLLGTWLRYNQSHSCLYMIRIYIYSSLHYFIILTKSSKKYFLNYPKCWVYLTIHPDAKAIVCTFLNANNEQERYLAWYDISKRLVREFCFVLTQSNNATKLLPPVPFSRRLRS